LFYKAKYSPELEKHGQANLPMLNWLIDLPHKDHDNSALLKQAEKCKNIRLIENYHYGRFLLYFWQADHVKALEASHLVLSCPGSKMPKIQLVYFTFYRGLVCFKRYREGDGENLFIEGNGILAKLQSWRQYSKAIVNNKILLLEAEYFAANCDRNMAIEKYNAAAKAARDAGYLHDQALAYECLGAYLESIVELPESRSALCQANECYIQWGAKGKSRNLIEQYSLDFDINGDKSTAKRNREEC